MIAVSPLLMLIAPSLTPIFLVFGSYPVCHLLGLSGAWSLSFAKAFREVVELGTNVTSSWSCRSKVTSERSAFRFPLTSILTKNSSLPKYLAFVDTFTYFFPTSEIVPNISYVTALAALSGFSVSTKSPLISRSEFAPAICNLLIRLFVADFSGVETSKLEFSESVFWLLSFI